MILLLPLVSLQKTKDKIVSVGLAITNVFKFALNTLSKSVFQIKELFMINSFAVKAFVWCVAAFLWRHGVMLPHTRDRREI